MSDQHGRVEIAHVLMEMDRVLELHRSLCDSVGLGCRRFLSGEPAPDWIVKEVLDFFPCSDLEVWSKLSVRLRSMLGEIAACEELLSDTREKFKSFPRNTTKEPL